MLVGREPLLIEGTSATKPHAVGDTVFVKFEQPYVIADEAEEVPSAA